MSKSELTNKLHIFTLATFAFAQPLYDLLGRSAEFFAVRNNGITDIILFVCFLNLLIPAVFILTAESGRLFGKGKQHLSRLCTIALLVAIIVQPVLKKIPAINTAFTLGFTLILSIGFITLYNKKQAAQLFLTYLSPAIIIFPLLFILNTPVYYLMFPIDVPQPKTAGIRSTTPIVMMIFDELPVSTLMSGKDKIDHLLFPGFSSLAKTSTWYPNTTTVAEYTVQAVPALLTGNMPPEHDHQDHPKNTIKDWLDIPSFNQYPKNMFTALGEHHELRVFETVTGLCPESLCKRDDNYLPHLEQRLQDLFDDLLLVYLHITLPEDFRSKLPRVDMGWADFVRSNKNIIHDGPKHDDVSVFNRFVDSLTPSDKPAFYFHHSKLPHSPWRYLPSGKTYNSSGQSGELDPRRIWKEGSDLRKPLQRHILQTMYTDKLLSMALDKLKNENIFDDAIIIVTADHGASFKHGEKFREASKNNYADILNIPLFIKYPNQKEASIDNTQIQMIDIIPIIFDTIGGIFPWKTDGKTLEEKNGEDTNKLPLVTDKRVTKYFQYNPDKKLEAVNSKLKLFGDIGLDGIYGGPDHAHLIGKPIDLNCAQKLPEFRIVDSDKNFSAVDLSTPVLASSVKVILAENLTTASDVHVITVNSNIAAVLPSKSLNNGLKHFSTMIDSRLIKSGNNRVDSYALNTTRDCSF